MTIRDIFENKIAKKLAKKKEVSKEIGVALAVKITGEDESRWMLDCSKNPAKVYESDEDHAEMEITMKGSDFIKLISGELNPQRAFLFGKIKIKGNVGLAIKLGKLLS